MWQFFNEWGNAASVVGFPLSVIGFIATLRTVWQAKTAAEQAKAAAEQALAQSQHAFHRYAVANAHRYVNEALIHVASEKWLFASGRLGDLADQMVQLAHLDKTDRAAWTSLIEELRTWSQTMEQLNNNAGKKFASPKWSSFTVRLKSRLDAHFGPFVTNQEQK